MDKETQEELLQAAKRALKYISIARLDRDFVFYLRDLIRKIEADKCPHQKFSEESTSEA